MHIRRNASAHIEFTEDVCSAGSILLTVEDGASGEFSVAGTFEIGPFDTGLDVAVFLMKALRDAKVLTV